MTKTDQEEDRPGAAERTEVIIDDPTDYLEDEDKPFRRLSKRYTCMRVGEDLTYRAKRIQEQPIIGRDKELDDLITLLSWRGKRNVIIIGPAGVGKSVLVEGLAHRIVLGQVPRELQNTRIIMTSFAHMWAAVGNSDNWGQYLESMKELIEECRTLPAILFYDEIHVIACHEYSMNFLLPYLARGDITLMGTTTEREYYTFIDQNRAFARRFHLYPLKAPSRPVVKEIIYQVMKKHYPDQDTETLFPPRVADYLIQLSDHYIPFMQHPAKAVDLMDRIFARRIFGSAEKPVSKRDVRQAVATTVGIPEDAVSMPAKRLEAMENVLNAHILGQKEAVSQLCRRLIITKLGFGIDPFKPDGVFLLAGPTGVGKTELAKALASYLTGSEEGLVRLDMSTYSTIEGIYALLGVTGVQSTDQWVRVPHFTRKMKERPYGVLLLDEIEKAHPSVLLLFLHGFDTGFMVDLIGNEIQLSNMVVIMTTNLGFSVRQPVVALPGQSAEEIVRQEEEAAMGVIRERFPPEFLGRIDEIIFFKPLTAEVMKGFVGQKIRQLERVTGKQISITHEALAFLCRQGFDPRYGARELNRAIDVHLGHALARLRCRIEEKWDQVAKLHVRLKSDQQELIIHYRSR